MMVGTRKSEMRRLDLNKPKDYYALGSWSTTVIFRALARIEQLTRPLSCRSSLADTSPVLIGDMGNEEEVGGVRRLA